MRNSWLQIILFLSIIFIFIIFYKQIRKLREPEGFVQKEKFIVKYNNDIYDSFYSEIYDEINKTNIRLEKELSIIINLTQADYNNSYFLDIGSGTGYAVNELNELGYNAFGVDQSEAMIKYSETKYPNSNYKCGDIIEPMLFEKNIFTHVLCLYYTIYHFKDKQMFFRNCYHWIQPGGYLIVHIVDPSKFDMAVPSAKNDFFGSPKKKNDLRNKDSIVDFTHFQYKSSYHELNSTRSSPLSTSESTSSCSSVEPILLQIETFKDRETNSIRQNEKQLYMENIQEIIRMAIYNGFTIKSKVELKSSMMDENQYLYFFERLL